MECSDCGAQVPHDADFCKYCGATFHSGGETPWEQNQGAKETTSSRFGLTGVIGLILLIGGVVVAITAHQNMAEFQTTGGQIIRALSQQQQQEYQMYSNTRVGGAVAAVIGGLLSFAKLS